MLTLFMIKIHNFHSKIILVKESESLLIKNQMKNLDKILLSLLLFVCFYINANCQTITNEIERLVNEPTLRKCFPNLQFKIDTIRHSQAYIGSDGKTMNYYYSDYKVEIFDINKIFSKIYLGKPGPTLMNEIGAKPENGVIYMDEIYDVLLNNKSEDQLVEIADNTTFDPLGLYLLKKISNQNSLAYISKNSKNIIVSKAANDKFLTINSIESGTMKDPRDGNTYKIVKIGSQWIMAENLAYKPKSGKFWAYDDNPSKYGYCYDWETAKSIAPDGWHLPTKDEWLTLINFLGSDEKDERTKGTIVLDKIKEDGQSGFQAYLYGYCNSNGIFFSKGNIAQFWSSTEYNENNIWSFLINELFHGAYLEFNSPKSIGFNIRLFRDK
jgi:uncharacterized protein (TIGR02145 family)